MKRLLKATAGIAISAACMLLAFRSVSLNQLWAVLPSIPVEIVAACLAVGSSTLFLRSLRWRILLQASEPVSVGTAFAVNAAGQMGNSILPARVGDLFRATNLGRAGLSSGFVLATVVVERVLDAGALVLISALVLAGREDHAMWLVRASRLVAVAAVAGLAVTILLPRFEPFLMRLVQAVAPARWLVRVERLTQQFLLGLRSFHHLGRGASFLMLTFVIWLVDSSGVILLAYGFGLKLALSQAVLMITAMALSSAVPAAPGNLGVLQYVIVTVLATFGVARTEALGLGLILQVINTVTLSLWGLAGLWFLSARRGTGDRTPVSGSAQGITSASVV